MEREREGGGGAVRKEAKSAKTAWTIATSKYMGSMELHELGAIGHLKSSLLTKMCTGNCQISW